MESERGSRLPHPACSQLGGQSSSELAVLQQLVRYGIAIYNQSIASIHYRIFVPFSPVNAAVSFEMDVIITATDPLRMTSGSLCFYSDVDTSEDECSSPAEITPQLLVSVNKQARLLFNAIIP